MLQPGEIIGKWRVERTLGAGAMAVVYEVRHVELGGRAALKVLSSAHPGLRARMLREGRAQARLEHPGVVRVQDVLEVQERPALLMDFVDGSDLASWRRVTEPDLAEVERMLRDIASPLRAAHAHGIVHRDLKPANILVGRDGKPRIADFGIARVLDDSDSGTRSGMAMGTPAYMAPEQIRNAADADARADVFALGVIGWELVTGTRPTEVGADIIRAYDLKMGGPETALRDLRPDCPEPLARAIEGALHGAREQRLASVDLFLAVLDGDEDALADIEATFAPVTAEVELPSDLLARYTLVQAFQEGPVAYSWRATDAGRSDVFVKGLVLPRADAKALELAEREGAVLRQIQHPAIPRWVETFRGEHGGQPMLFVVREWVDGQPLSLELEEHRYSELEVLDILDEVGGILTYLHGLEPPVVHRDLQPDNLIRRPDRSLALVDFGSVRDALMETLGGDTVAGTFGYMAPEQFAGDATPATDAYGLGALAVALLGRRDPRTLMDRARRFRWKDAVEASPPMETVLERLLADEPSSRFADAGAALQALREARTALATLPDERSTMREAKALFEPTPEAAALVPAGSAKTPAAPADSARASDIPVGAVLAGTGGIVVLAVVAIIAIVFITMMAISSRSPGPGRQPAASANGPTQHVQDRLRNDPAVQHCLRGFADVPGAGNTNLPVEVQVDAGIVVELDVQEHGDTAPARCLERAALGKATNRGGEIAVLKGTFEIQLPVPESSNTRIVSTLPEETRLGIEQAAWESNAVRGCYDIAGLEYGSEDAGRVARLLVGGSGVMAVTVSNEESSALGRCLVPALHDLAVGPFDMQVENSAGELVQQAPAPVLVRVGAKPTDPAIRERIQKLRQSYEDSGIEDCIQAWRNSKPDGDEARLAISVTHRKDGTTSVDWTPDTLEGTPLDVCAERRAADMEWGGYGTMKFVSEIVTPFSD